MKSENKDGVLVIFLEGNVLGEHIKGSIMDLIHSNIEAGNKKLIFNMADMKYIDSIGLGALLSAVSKVRTAGGVTVLCNLPDQMTKLLKMTKLESAFNQQPNEEGAIAFLSK
jgi:anti-sigma B factor antagonist